MSSIVKYNNKNLVPISTITINTSMAVNTDNTCVKPTYTIDMNGYLIYNCGSPTSSGTFGDYTAEQCETISLDSRINSLIAKHTAVIELFSENYKELELGTSSGSPNLTAYPKVLSVNLTETASPSYWLYTISLEAHDLFRSGASISPTGCGYNIKSFDESWDISYDESEFLSESGDNRLFKVSHQISAVGIVAGSSGSYVSAKEFINSKKGQNAIIPSVCISGFNNAGPLYNYVEAHNVDVANGSYSVSENWILCTTPYIESYVVDIQDSADIACPTVSIQGTIKGFDVRNTSGVISGAGSRFYNANTRWEYLESTSGIYVNATGISGYTLNTNPVSSNVTKNKFNGEIAYNRTYRNQQFRFLTSAKSENITYGTNWGEDSFASIQLLNGGQVLHPLNYSNSGILMGKNLSKANLSINAVYPCGTGISRKGPRFTAPYSGELQAVVDYYNPTGDLTNWFTVVESQNETWVPADGSYSYTISFVSQPSGNCNLF